MLRSVLILAGLVMPYGIIGSYTNIEEIKIFLYSNSINIHLTKKKLHFHFACSGKHFYFPFMKFIFHELFQRWSPIEGDHNFFNWIELFWFQLRQVRPYPIYHRPNLEQFVIIWTIPRLHLGIIIEINHISEIIESITRHHICDWGIFVPSAQYIR